MARTTLRQARRTLAGLLGGYTTVTAGVQGSVIGTTWTVTATSGYTGIASGADAKRTIISSDLADVNNAGDGGDTDPGWWNGGFSYLLNTVPEQRRIATKSFDGQNDSAAVSDQITGLTVGSLVMARALGTVLAAGTAVELHRTLPPLDSDIGEGLHSCINRALMAVPFEYEVSIVGNGTKLVDVSNLDWLWSTSQYIQVYDAPSGTDALGVAHTDGATLYFNGPVITLSSNYVFASGTTFTLKLWRPSGTLIKVGGSWQDSTVGMVHDTDEAFIDPKTLELASSYYAYKVLSRVHKGSGQGDHYRGLMSEAATLAKPLLMLDTEMNDEVREYGSQDTVFTGYSTMPPPDNGGSWP